MKFGLSVLIIISVSHHNAPLEFFAFNTESCQKWQYFHQRILQQYDDTGSELFFATVKSFDANIAISGNLVLNAKNSTALIYFYVCRLYIDQRHLAESCRARILLSVQNLNMV